MLALHLYLDSFTVEEWNKVRGGDKPGCLTENSPAGARVEFGVVGDGQRLTLAQGAVTAQFDVASPL